MVPEAVDDILWRVAVRDGGEHWLAAGDLEGGDIDLAAVDVGGLEGVEGVVGHRRRVRVAVLARRVETVAVWRDDAGGNAARGGLFRDGEEIDGTHDTEVPDFAGEGRVQIMSVIGSKERMDVKWEHIWEDLRLTRMIAPSRRCGQSCWSWSGRSEARRPEADLMVVDLLERT